MTESASPLPYVDVHTHLLPGVDDGCATIEESIAVARDAVARGCHTMVCTPHVGTDRYFLNTPPQIAQATEQLQQFLNDARVALKLVPSGEFRLSEQSISWFETHGAPVLGQSNVVLIDTWAQAWEECYDDAIEWLFANGFQPLLAHPERMLIPNEQWKPLIQRLEERGVWLQGNFKSFAQLDAVRVQERAWRLLDEDRYLILASDTHAFQSIGPRADGLALLKRRLDGARFQQLTHDNPARVLAGKVPQPVQKPTEA